MANIDLESLNFVDKRRGNGWSGASSLAEQNNYDNITDLRTRLTALNGSYFTSARLDGMSKNDMQFALRGLGDSAGI